MIISAYSKFLSYYAGGAELSTISLLEKQCTNSTKIKIISHKDPKFGGTPLLPRSFPMQWENCYIPNLTCFNKFSYYEYLFNRDKLIRWFSDLESNELWAYGIDAPAAIIGFGGKSKYFIRSESDLGIDSNYYRGSIRFLKSIYTVSQSPAKNVYYRDLTFAIERSTVITNSKFMASRTKLLFGIDSEVVYPHVDISLHRKYLNDDRLESNWIVFVGDSEVKGISQVLFAAKKLPYLNFRIFTRFTNYPRIDGNITWMPWEKDSWRVYSGARLVIVPSQWEEAYGRVAREAYLLKIPVLVSNVGGLPEAVDEDQSCLVGDFSNPDEWVKRICEILSI